MKLNSWFIAAGIFLIFSNTLMAETEKVSAKKDLKGKESVAESNEAKYDLGDFSYTSEGKRDPFQAVLIMKAKAASEERSVKSKKAKSAPVEYELEALKLVGVLKSEKGMIAMMEDTQGKGIFFRKNDQLNKNMWVADISAKDVTLAYKLKGETKTIVVDIPEKK